MGRAIGTVLLVLLLACDCATAGSPAPAPTRPAAPRRLHVTIDESVPFAEGTHFGKFLKLRDGTILCGDRLSRDGGKTWEASAGGFGAGGEELRDGEVVGMEYRCLPIDGEPGWYTTTRWMSKDSGKRFSREAARFEVPEAKGAMGHAYHPGPLFMRSILERKDGSLVALMAGWFKSDTVICPYGHGRPYSRSYVCESSDRGATWKYLATLGSGPIGSEGYNEGSMRRLPNADWLAVLRTGNPNDRGHPDNPIMWTISRDEGKTWSEPRRTGVNGVYPSLAVLGDGKVVMSYGRPGAYVVFSADGRKTWTDTTGIDKTPYSGYTDVLEVSPGTLLVGFGTRGFVDPVIKARGNQLRLVRVHYRSE